MAGAWKMFRQTGSGDRCRHLHQHRHSCLMEVLSWWHHCTGFTHEAGGHVHALAGCRLWERPGTEPGPEGLSVTWHQHSRQLLFPGAQGHGFTGSRRKWIALLPTRISHTLNQYCYRRSSMLHLLHPSLKSQDIGSPGTGSSADWMKYSGFNSTQFTCIFHAVCSWPLLWPVLTPAFVFPVKSHPIPE